MSYYDMYQLRLNRYGLNYQDRVQTEREKLFDKYLAKSLYKVEFIYNNVEHIGSFEKYKQDNTESLHYLLTRNDLIMPSGTILQINDADNVSQNWMIYYREKIQASGYNRYIMLKMTHSLSWKDRSGITRTSYAYMYGQEDNMLRDELKSRSRMDTLYTENLKSSFFVMPKNQYLKKDDYFIIGTSPFQEYYRITGYDIQSTEGVEFVTVDPVYEYDLTAAPSQLPTDPDEDFFWLKGGNP